VIQKRRLQWTVLEQSGKLKKKKSQYLTSKWYKQKDRQNITLFLFSLSLPANPISKRSWKSAAMVAYRQV
jgi:hypothetical protein